MRSWPGQRQRARPMSHTLVVQATTTLSAVCTPLVHARCCTFPPSSAPPPPPRVPQPSRRVVHVPHRNKELCLCQCIAVSQDSSSIRGAPRCRWHRPERCPAAVADPQPRPAAAAAPSRRTAHRLRPAAVLDLTGPASGRQHRPAPAQVVPGPQISLHPGKGSLLGASSTPLLAHAQVVPHTPTSPRMPPFVGAVLTCRKSACSFDGSGCDEDDCPDAMVPGLLWPALAGGGSKSSPRC